jgi:hypothetical protein
MICGNGRAKHTKLFQTYQTKMNIPQLVERKFLFSSDQPVTAPLYEIVIAQNGVFKRARLREMNAVIELSAFTVKIPELAVGEARVELAEKIPATIFEEILTHTRSTTDAANFTENLYAVCRNEQCGDYFWKEISRHRSFAGTIARDDDPAYKEAVLEIHTYPPNWRNFSSQDDCDESGKFRLMPFDLTALEQVGIFLNIDATRFSVLSRQLDWQSLGIELPKEQSVHLSPPRTGLLPDDYRKPLLRAASQAHHALDRYSFRFTLCETLLGSSEYRWIPFTAFEAFEKEFAAALETLARAKAEVVENYPEILEILRETFRQLATDSAERLTATLKDEPFDRDEFINTTVARAMQMIPTVATIRDGMRIEMRPKVILLGSEMCAEQVKSAKLELETQETRKAKREIAIEIEAQKEIAKIKVKSAFEDEKREQELKERIRQIKIEAVKREMEASVSPLKEGFDQLNSTIYEAAKEMAEKLNDAKFVPGGTAKRAREMYRWFKLMNFTGDEEVETVLAELNKIASRDAKQHTSAEIKEAVTQ